MNSSGNPVATSPCWSCGGPIEVLNFGRQDSCPKCGKDTKVCKNCIFYDPALHNECREPQADRVVEKEKANFCDYFKPGGKGGNTMSAKDALKAQADALFKKKP